MKFKGGYARVSSREQAENSHALEQQIARLKASGVEKIYCDVDSGAKNSRKDFNRMLSDIRLGLMSDVTITRLDRLTRSLVTMRKTLDIFAECKTPLIALDDSIDTSTAAGFVAKDDEGKVFGCPEKQNFLTRNSYTEGF